MLNVLKSILDEQDTHVYVTDMETDEILFVNRKAKNTFDIDEGYVGQKCWKVIQKGYSERCPFCPVFKLEENPDTPVTWEAYNSVTGRYYKNTDSVIDWVDGRKVHLQYAIDMTDIKNAQHDAANMLSILKNILNGMDAYVYVSDMETDEILFINNRMKEVFNLDDRAVGKICWKVLQEGFTQRCSFCPNFKLEKNPDERVIWQEHNTVTKRHYKNVDSVIDWMDGKKVHMQHSTDITDILAAQEETHALTERLEIALLTSQAGVWEIDFEAEQLTYDAMCAKLFMFDPNRQTMSLDELAAHLEATMQGTSGADMVRDLKEGDPYAQALSRDFYFVFPGGVERYIRNYGNRIRNNDGQGNRAIGMCIDITANVLMENELKAAKEAAENASRAKSQFLSNMSHEIRTPMNAILGMADILQNEELGERQLGYVNDIKMSSTALLGIINDILDFSKIEAGKLQLVSVDYDLMELLQNIGSMFAFVAEKKGIAFTMDLRGDLPACLHGDDIRLRQALVNVLGNAVKFTKEGGVTFVAEAVGDRLRFDVIDTGIGIKPEHMPHIFNDFDRLDLRSTRTIAGTGLGLSITKSLLDMMDGKVWAESEPGRGTVFHLEVPLVPGDPEKITKPEAEEFFIEAPEAKVLVVDDTEVNLHVASGLLKLYGINCDTVLSGAEAVEMVRAKQYDIVFMDHMMPEMDGIETTRRLREEHGAGLVIVALTANAVAGARTLLLGAAMDDYLSKPIDKTQLNQILRKWLPPGKVREGKKREKKPARESLSAALQRVSAVPGVDVRLGLERIGGMQEAYETSLGIFTRRLPRVMDRLTVFLENGDEKNFSIEVHGVKGSLNNIGVMETGRLAEELEHKSKAGDLHFCRENLPALIAALSGLQAKLAEALAGSAPAAPALPGDRETLQRQLPVIRTLLETFEGDEARALVLALSNYDYGEGANKALKELRLQIEEFEYDQAVAVIDSM